MSNINNLHNTTYFHSSPLENTNSFIRQLENTKKNPVHHLVKDAQKNGGAFGLSSIISILTAVIASFALIGGIVSFYYTFKQGGGNLNNPPGGGGAAEQRGIKFITSSSTATINIHHLCIIGNNNIDITLPDPTLFAEGTYVSIANANAFVTNTNGGGGDLGMEYQGITYYILPDNGNYVRILGSFYNYILYKNKGALFFVTSELGVKKWKLVREWNGDNEWAA